jgi:hypothetical protein
VLDCSLDDIAAPITRAAWGAAFPASRATSQLASGAAPPILHGQDRDGSDEADYGSGSGLAK